MVFPGNNQPESKKITPCRQVVPRGQSSEFPTLRFASFLGDNAFELYRQIVVYVGRVTGCATEMVTGLSPSEQEAMVNQAVIQAVFTCGLPYVCKADHDPPLLRLIAAPVLTAQRYRNRPIYFADIIVHRDSAFQTFEDLRGATFAYNEVHSLSGYLAVCHHLLSQGEKGGFFGRAVPSGTHAASMDWVEQGRVNSAAIDSVVLDMELTQRPERAAVFRVIEQIGPFPMPPVAAVAGLEESVCRQLGEVLLIMHNDELGRAVLNRAGIRRFARVVDRDYDPIRRVVQKLKNGPEIQLA